MAVDIGADKVGPVSLAVFVSYASQDIVAAARICDALRQAGLEVWFDQSELRGGDVWDQKIRREVGDCALFIPIISANTASRHEGYFRLEWDLADRRTHMMARNRVFIVPVCLDATPEAGTDVPESFHRVQWTRLLRGNTPAEFAARIAQLLSAPSPISSAAKLTGLSGPPLVVAPRGGGSAFTRRGALPVAVTALAATALIWVFLVRPWNRGQTPAAFNSIDGSIQITSPTASNALSVGASFAPPAHSVAVLPFVNMSGDAKQDYFSDGVSEELLNALVGVKGLQVAARTSSFSFKGRNVDVSTIAQKLNVRALLEGSVRRAGSTVRITVQLIDTLSGFHLWSQTYDRNLRDILKMQSEVAGAVATQLKITLATDDLTNVESHDTSAAAYTLFLAGKSAYRNADTKAENDAAAELLRRSVAADPELTEGWLFLEFTLSDEIISGLVKPEAVSAEMRHAAGEVLALAPGSAMAHRALAQIYWSVDWNWQAATAEYRRTYELLPGDSNVVRQFADVSHAILREDASAFKLYLRSIELDPLSPSSYLQIGHFYLDSGKLPDAESASRRSLALDPKNAETRALLCETMVARGEAAQALAAVQRESDDAAHRWCAAIAYQSLGRGERADAAMTSVEQKDANDAPYSIARLHAYRGEVDLAFLWLDRALRQRDFYLNNLNVDPLLQSLKGDPRYSGLLRQLQLPK